MDVRNAGYFTSPSTPVSFQITVTEEMTAPATASQEDGSHEWETEVGDDFSLFYDSYSVDGHVDSDSKVGELNLALGAVPVPLFHRAEGHKWVAFFVSNLETHVVSRVVAFASS